MDLRNNQDDRPYRVTRSDYGVSTPRRENWDEETLSTQGYYREVLRNITEQRWFPLAAVTMGVVVFGSLIAFAYRQGAQTNPNATTPLIQAENTPYKERPQDPGGMDVPFQDAIVFDQLDKTKSANAGEKVENLLPPPEQPVADPVKETADASQAASETAPPSAPREESEDKSVIAEAPADSIADKIAATEAAMKSKTTEAATKVEQAAAKTTDTVKEETQKTVAAAKTIPAKAASTTTTTAQKAATLNAVAPAAPTPVASNVASTGNAKVQLGAFKDEAAARAAWAQFQKQYAPHLNGVTPNYARADLGAKGVFYRVQGVNLSQAKAKSICQSINSIKSGSCLIPQ